MPVDDDSQSIQKDMYERIIARSLNGEKNFKKLYIGRFAEDLTNEFRLDYSRTMNGMIFEHEVD